MSGVPYYKLRDLWTGVVRRASYETIQALAQSLSPPQDPGLVLDHIAKAAEKYRVARATGLVRPDLAESGVVNPRRMPKRLRQRLQEAQSARQSTPKPSDPSIVDPGGSQAPKEVLDWLESLDTDIPVDPKKS